MKTIEKNIKASIAFWTESFGYAGNRRIYSGENLSRQIGKAAAAISSLQCLKEPPEMKVEYGMAKPTGPVSITVKDAAYENPVGETEVAGFPDSVFGIPALCKKTPNDCVPAAVLKISATAELGSREDCAALLDAFGFFKVGSAGGYGVCVAAEDEETYHGFWKNQIDGSDFVERDEKHDSKWFECASDGSRHLEFDCVDSWDLFNVVGMENLADGLLRALIGSAAYDELRQDLLAEYPNFVFDAFMRKYYDLLECQKSAKTALLPTKVCNCDDIQNLL